MARVPMSDALRRRLKDRIASPGSSGRVRSSSGVTTASIQSGVRSSMRSARQAMAEVYDSSSEENRAGWLASIGDVFMGSVEPASASEEFFTPPPSPETEEVPEVVTELPQPEVTPEPEPTDTEEDVLKSNTVAIDIDDLQSIIRREASLRNIDPEVAIRLWRSEGNTSYQSNIERTGRGSYRGREASFGPFQLYTGGGLGNDYERLTGRELVNDNNLEGITKQIQFALDMAVDQGWTPWYGRNTAGISPRQGLENSVQVFNWRE